MNRSTPLIPRNARAAPLKIKRRPPSLDDSTVLFQDRRIFFTLLCLRIFNALTICTFFQPDEYYQSLEPAWNVVYGYGEITWEWKEVIRGFMYPSIFAIAWRICKLLGIENADTLVLTVMNCIEEVDRCTQDCTSCVCFIMRLLDLSPRPKVI